MLFKGVNNIFIILLQCGVLIMCVFWDDTLRSVGYAQEIPILSISNQLGKTRESQRRRSRASFNSVVCSEKQKSDCQSPPLSVELVERDEVFYGTTSPYSLVRTSFSQPQKEFLTIEIYVDREHRNFQDEIIEIFDQSLVLQTWQGGVPIVLECHCDDREPMAYSFILGHLWGKRAKAYLQNLAIHSARVELLNYGNEYGMCESHSGECQDGSRLQAAFRFLAIGKSHSGCLIRLKLPSQRTHRQMVFKEHPLFLQEIHVAGVWSRRVP